MIPGAGRGMAAVWVIVLALVLMHLYERGERRYLERTWEQFDLRIGREFFPQQQKYHEAVRRQRAEISRLAGLQVEQVNRFERIAASLSSQVASVVAQQEQARVQLRGLQEQLGLVPEYAGRTWWSRRR